MGLLGKGAVIALLAAVGYSLYSTYVFEPSPVVKIEDGQLQGRKAWSRGGKEYSQYLGIPFAQPPVGELRFEAPVPAKAWSGVKQVTKYPPHCAQFDGLLLGKEMGVEDCLFLNVMTKDVQSKQKKPVLVWIHGGGFLTGTSSMYHPQYLMDEDIVLVTINYRLGPLGFLNTGDELIRGNMGMKDQVLALKWVQKNIAKFGGDPSAVTIFGESAGAASVHYHVLSPASTGLFQRAIAQSGSVACPWAFMGNAKEATFNYGKLVGCPTDNSKVLVDCLKKMDPLEMSRPQVEFLNVVSGFQMLSPSIEGVVKDDTFLSENPAKLLKEGKFQKVPLIMGVTSGEGGIRTARLDAMPEAIPQLDKEWETKFASLLFMDDCPTTAAKKIRDFYFGTGPFPVDSEGLKEFKQKFTDMMSDGMFNTGVRKAALAHAKQGAPTYLYYYDYVPKSFPAFYSVFKAVRPDDWMLSELKIFLTAAKDWIGVNCLGWNGGPHAYGITHADDLMQMWGTDGAIFSSKDLDFSQNFVKLFVDFAKQEEPLKFKGIIWPAVKPVNEAPTYLYLHKEPKIIPEPFTKRLHFWESLNLAY